MSTPRFTVTCTGKKVIARKVYEVTLSKPAGFTFRPGQFVLFSVPLVGNPTDIQPRAYSIASTPEEPDLKFVIKLKPGGRASAWVEQSLREGSTVELLGPLGSFLANESVRDCIFVATGVGVAPFRSQILTTLTQGDARRFDLIFGAFTEEDLFWSQEFTSLVKTHRNFTYTVVLSQPSPQWTGYRGWVQAFIDRVENFRERSVAICGNPDMVKDVQRLCLEEWGIPGEQVKTEGYG